MKKHQGVIDLSMAVIVGALVVLAIIVGLVQQQRIGALRVQHAETLTDVAQANEKAMRALATYREAVDTESRAMAALLKTQGEKTDEKLQTLAAAVDSERTGRMHEQRSFKQQISHWQSVARGASTAAERDASAAAIGVLADVLGRLDARAGIYAATADRCRIGANACQAAYQTIADRINAGPPKED